VLSEFQKQKLQRYFRTYDIDNSGFIDITDIQRLLNQYAQILNWSLNSPEYSTLESNFMSRWEHILSFSDTNRDNKISWDEWLVYIDNLVSDPQSQVYAVEIAGITSSVFRMFDLDGDERLSLNEYRLLFKAADIDENIANEIFSKLNLNDDDYISKQQCLELIDQFFCSQDPEAPGNLVFGKVL
jgi:juvenile hormone diol kinase